MNPRYGKRPHISRVDNISTANDVADNHSLVTRLVNDFQALQSIGKNDSKKYLNFTWNKMRFKNIEKLKKMMLANSIFSHLYTSKALYGTSF